MKFPSLFRLPRNQHFEIKPRYYDAVKEDIQERTERIKRAHDAGNETYTPGNITFERKSRSTINTSFLQLLIATLLSGLVVGWLYFGNQVFFALWLLVPVYLFIRIRNMAKRK